MKKDEYLQKAFEAFNSGRVDENVYDAMVENADIFCDDDDDYDNDCYGLPSTYAEVEYSDFESAEAIDGAKFDDMNYLRYTER